MKNLAIFGVGGFGREVLTVIQAINNVEPEWNVVGFFDDGFEIGTIVNRYEVLGGVNELNAWKEPLSVIIAIGTPHIKQAIISKLSNPNLDFPTIVHPTVVIGDSNYVKIGKGCIICAGTIITTNIEIQDFVILNLACTVGHDTIIEKYSAFMPSVNISGEVLIGEGVYVGTGARIINQISIGKNTIVGAGAVVVRDLPPNCTAVGLPAKVIKRN